MSKSIENISTVPSLEFDRGTLIIQKPTSTMVIHLSDLARWDERVGSWRAPAYLYAKLTSRMRLLGEPLIDQVRKPQQLDKAWQPVALRDYQETALQAWRASAGRGLICLPTGAGKTRVALAAAQRSQKSVLCLVPTRVLLEQWQESIREFYPGTIGVLGDGRHDIAPVTVATFESAFRKAWSFGNRFDLLIIDEAHHFGDGERDEALEACTASFRLGLSATLEESRMDRLSQLIGPKIFEQTIRDLVGTALSEFDLWRLHLPLTSAESKAYHADYDVFRKFFCAYQEEQATGSWEAFVTRASRSPEGQAALAAHRRSKRVLAYTEKKETMLRQLLEKHKHQRKLIFTADSITALTIARRLTLAPMTAEISKSERNRYLADFKSGLIKSLVSCKVLNEGFNVPEAEVAIIVGGSGSDREHIQRIGRVLRPIDGKRAQIYELLAAGTSEIGLSKRRGFSFDES